MFTSDNYKDVSEKEFYDDFSHIMQAAMFCDEKLYVWLIDNMYEIFDRDKSTMEELLNRFGAINFNLEDHIADSFFEYFKDTYSYGECISLSSVFYAFISWKEELLSMEEYYEIRDMFVPFNLPISFQTDSLQNLLEIIRDKTQKNYSFTLLKRVGKKAENILVTEEKIVLALDELNFSDMD